MKDFSNENFVMMPVPASMFAAVCALVGGGAGMPVARGSTAAEAARKPEPQPETGKPDAAPAAEQPAGGNGAGAASDEVDAGGHPWSADLHAATKSKTKEGLWRMKVGVSRPDPLPGSPAATGAATAAPAGGAASAATAPAPADDDEFAAFREAAAKQANAGAAAAAGAQVRKWTDGDLSKLCNQAAVKMNDPQPIKDLIAQYVPAGEPSHSRMIPEAERENFAKALEAKAGITFEG